MDLSAKGEYGILAALDLALTRDAIPVQAKAIAERQRIPIKFLEHILRALRNAGLVESSRGIHGGYRLAKPAGEILMGDLIQAVEGPIAGTHRPHGARNGSNGKGPHSSRELLIQTLWADVQDSMLETLNKTTLADLCRQTRELDEQRVPMYHI
jgi:Rrf2 family cysteine metabolism transcriptional repressor